jgi:L-lactate dehydrogenase complex protein LldG
VAALSAREHVLARIRSALADVPATEGPGDVPVPRDYLRTLGLAHAEVVERLVERLGDYGTDVRRCAPGQEAATIAGALAAQGARRVGIPADLPHAWRPDRVELVEDRNLPVRGSAGLEGLDGVLTACSVAIAETGTICLAGGVGDGRRALTLVPDLHVCVVRSAQVASSVPEGIAALGAAARSGRPITLASGPSATSDIEMNRVAGVHGPRRLVVVLVG